MSSVGYYEGKSTIMSCNLIWKRLRLSYFIDTWLRIAKVEATIQDEWHLQANTNLYLECRKKANINFQI